MRRARSTLIGGIVTILSLLAVSGTATATSIGLYSTGTDSSGNALPVNGIDAHYQVAASGGGPSDFLSYYTPNSYSFGNAYHPSFDWGLGDATSSEISCNALNFPCDNNNAWVYRTTFDLTGFDLSSVVLDLTGYFDDKGQLAVNGNLVGGTYRQYSGPDNFILTAANAGFVAGVNTLDIVSVNQGGPGGVYLKVNDVSAVPEPASLFLVGTGLAAVVRRARRSRRALQL
jgi:hypothetical protein